MDASEHDFFNQDFKPSGVTSYSEFSLIPTSPIPISYFLLFSHYSRNEDIIFGLSPGVMIRDKERTVEIYTTLTPIPRVLHFKHQDKDGSTKAYITTSLRAKVSVAVSNGEVKISNDRVKIIVSSIKNYPNTSVGFGYHFRTKLPFVSLKKKQGVLGSSYGAQIGSNSHFFFENLFTFFPDFHFIHKIILSAEGVTEFFGIKMRGLNLVVPVKFASQNSSWFNFVYFLGMVCRGMFLKWVWREVNKISGHRRMNEILREVKVVEAERKKNAIINYVNMMENISGPMCKHLRQVVCGPRVENIESSSSLLTEFERDPRRIVDLTSVAKYYARNGILSLPADKCEAFGKSLEGFNSPNNRIYVISMSSNGLEKIRAYQINEPIYIDFAKD